MLPWFVRDYIAATRHFSLAERGAYCDLLFLSWETGPLPNDPVLLARMISCTPAEFRRVWAAVRLKFRETRDGLINVRLEEHREKELAFHTRAVAGGHARAKQANRVNGRFAPASDQQDRQLTASHGTSHQLDDKLPAQRQVPSPSPSPSKNPVSTAPKIPTSAPRPDSELDLSVAHRTSAPAGPKRVTSGDILGAIDRGRGRGK
jgi:uncharacterized protein YdaU (DUF1376 family)